MIELMKGLPDTVVAFEGVGEVTADDYRDVLVPAIDRAIAEHGDIGVLYLLGERFTGYTGAAMVEDGVVGTEHFSHWRRIAVVSDTDWVKHAMHAFAWLMPSRMRVFPVSELDEARAWVALA